MKTLYIMLKPASALCNMRCKYCFYADVSQKRCIPSFGRMTESTVTAMLEQLSSELVAGDRVSFAFQGGEPTLAGLAFFRNFVSRTVAWEGIQVSYALQTNGILLDAEWCAFLKEYRFLVGLSLDLLPDAHDAVRVDSGGNGTYKRVLESMRLLKKHGVDFNVLCTLTNEIARHPRQVWEQIVKWELPFVQFTPCLGEIDGASSPFALTPQRFASFYKQLFALWYADYQKGKRRSIKLFDDIVNQMMLGRPTGCGMNGACQAQLVIEADGSAYPCDFYCLDEYKLGNITVQPVSELLASPAVQAFLTRPHKLPALCSSCPYRRFCGGNCKRMQREICCSDDDHFCGYQAFLEVCGATFVSIAESLRRAYFKIQR